MVIKFPQNIKEYTDGKLWRDGVDESIARRLLFTINTVDDEEEMWQRKFYLAYFYYKRGDYALASSLCKQLVLEGKELKNALNLLQYCCIHNDDYRGLSEAVMAAKALYPEDCTWFIEGGDDSAFVDLQQESYTSKKNVNVEFKDGWIEYYRDNNLIYKLLDKDFEVFNKDNEARIMLRNGEAEKALEILSSIKMEFLKKETLELCKQTYIRAYVALSDWKNAYLHCDYFFENNRYDDELLKIMIGLKTEGYEEEFEDLREFIINLTGFDTDQMCELFEYAETYDDMDFWGRLSIGNPLEKLKESDERLCLQACDYEYFGEHEKAEQCRNRAIALYGQFSKAKYYNMYNEINMAAYEKLKNKYSEAKSLGQDFVIEHLDVCTDIILEKMLADIKEQKGDITAANEKMWALDIALSNLEIDLKKMSESINKLYKSDFLPAKSEIIRLAVRSDADVINRAVCLANYFLYSDEKYIFFNGDLRNNLLTEFKDGNEQVKYGVAMFLSHCFIVFDAYEEDFSRLYIETKKLYNAVEWENYKDIKAYTVYILFLRYFTGVMIPEQRLDSQFADDVIPLRNAFSECSNGKDSDGDEFFHIAKLLESMRNQY